MRNFGSFLQTKPYRQGEKSHVSSMGESGNVMCRDFLYRLYLRILSLPGIKVTDMYGIPSYSHVMLRAPSPVLDTDLDTFIFFESYVAAIVVYKDARYSISLAKTFESAERTQFIEKFTAYICGLEDGAVYCVDLWKKLQVLSLRHSAMKNAILRFEYPAAPSSDFLNSLKKVKLPSVKLSDIFLPEEKMAEVHRFVFNMRNFRKLKKSYRIMLAGVPGVGKTKLMNAILNEVKGKVSVIICQGKKIPIDLIFAYAEALAPTILVIDDLDLIVKNRMDPGETDTLREFLARLDGMIRNESISLLATTNKKSLIDAALTRPGRFDVILDISEINTQNYLRLISRETSDAELISLFTEDVLRYFEQKKVTGAFIVSLTKQLVSLKKMNGELSGKSFMHFLQHNYNGFYDFNDLSFKKAVGF